VNTPFVILTLDWFFGIISAILKTIPNDFDEEAMDMNLESYASLRSKALKRIMRQLREETGYSQEAVARLLGCARTRITEIERAESTCEYSIAEIELLTTLFGKHPHQGFSQMLRRVHVDCKSTVW